ncbi:Kunitz/Bovine pancreatic trypsin inhibitor domain protein [Oesophagostomum dentatum]|uniref:Kunitz/Bovine pancreatic trypsin inhibitor domain protein n=1 Tax=Oesophagostomum dentatum TaxID=61180 RepID=A0A0B1THB8_OESDE|nr:Kunitz/Bovine pancreatic trypsin inhibitor domain protein [Oesophagostomum dentatum]
MRSIALLFVFCATASANFITDSRCKQPIDAGPCRGFELRYGYDNQSTKCKRFVYGGCLGNQNNFNTKAECEKACVETFAMPSRTIILQPQMLQPQMLQPQVLQPQMLFTPYTQPDFVPITIAPKTILFSYGYDNQSTKCKRFVYGGCLGNQNNFNTKAECEKACVETFAMPSKTIILQPQVLQSQMLQPQVLQPQLLFTPYTQPDFVPITIAPKTKPARCKKTIEPGNCFGEHAKFGYDSTLQKCVLFVYGGCGGNNNRFNTVEECRRTCED